MTKTTISSQKPVSSLITDLGSRASHSPGELIDSAGVRSVVQDAPRALHYDADSHLMQIDPATPLLPHPEDELRYELDSGKNKKASNLLLLLGCFLLLAAAICSALDAPAACGPVLSVLGLVLQGVSKRYDNHQLRTLKKMTQLENRKIASRLHAGRLGDCEMQNPLFEVGEYRGVERLARLGFAVQMSGLAVIAVSAFTPFIELVSRVPGVLMQLGWIVFTLGATLESHQHTVARKILADATASLKSKYPEAQIKASGDTQGR